jgi:hypothetical protein
MLATVDALVHAGERTLERRSGALNLGLFTVQ